jgi:hypothetical protein
MYRAISSNGGDGRVPNSSATALKRICILLALTAALVFAPQGRAAENCGSNGSAAEGQQRQGQIESVTPTNFSIKTGRRRRVKGIVVHYDPQTVEMTVDGVAMRTIDVRQTGKYAVVAGTIVNGVLEATSITITSAPPQRRKKGSSQAG